MREPRRKPFRAKTLFSLQTINKGAKLNLQGLDLTKQMADLARPCSFAGARCQPEL